MDRRQSSARCELARGRFARAHKSGSVVRRSDGDSLRAFSLREICCPTKAESPSDRQKTRIHSTAKSGRRNGQPQGCSLRSHRLRRLKPLTPTLSPAVHSAMPSMLHCCTSDLNRRLVSLARIAQIPQLERAVEAARQRSATVGRECDRSDTAKMPGKGADFTSARDLPQLQPVIEAPRQSKATVGCEGDRSDTARVRREG